MSSSDMVIGEDIAIRPDYEAGAGAPAFQAPGHESLGLEAEKETEGQARMVGRVGYNNTGASIDVDYAGLCFGGDIGNSALSERSPESFGSS